MNGFSATDFMSRGLPKGGARANLFKVSIPSPSGISGDIATDLVYRAKATSVPSSTVEAVEVPYGGRTYRFAGTRTYEDWTCTITLDEDQKEKAFFEDWNNLINDRVTGQSVNPEDYVKDIEIQMLGKDGSVQRTYTLIDAWPHTVGELTLDWSETGTILEVETTWAYSHWTVKAGTSTGESGDN
tara:strand:- start:802 stop:1356 length:555 start_codon:yes stop_codon:yes gene_type:complete